jgi:hypothetical protein
MFVIVGRQLTDVKAASVAAAVSRSTAESGQRLAVGSMAACKEID